MKNFYLVVACIPLLMMSARALADNARTVTDPAEIASVQQQLADQEAQKEAQVQAALAAASQRGPATEKSVASADLPLCTHSNPGVVENLPKTTTGDDTKMLDSTGRVSNSADTQKTDPPPTKTP